MHHMKWTPLLATLATLMSVLLTILTPSAASPSSGSEEREILHRLSAQLAALHGTLEELLRAPSGALLPKKTTPSGCFAPPSPLPDLPTPAAGPRDAAWFPSPVRDALHALATHGDADALRGLLASGSRVSSRDAFGDTALHAASRAGRANAVDTLLSFGADPRTLGRHLRTPLHCAAAHGHLRAAQSLVEGGAPLDALDARGATALDLAAQNNHTEVLLWLLSAGADPDASAHAASAESLLLRVARSGRWELAQALARKGAFAGARRRGEASPLGLAARADRADVLETMLLHGAVCDSADVREALEEVGGSEAVWALAQAAPRLVVGDAGKAALCRAAFDGREEALKALLHAGVEAHSVKDGDTALSNAASQGHAGCVVALLRAYENVTTKQLDVALALKVTRDSVVMKVLAELVPEVLRGKAGSEALSRSVQEGRCDNVGILLSIGLNSTERLVHGSSLLELAFLKGHTECVSLLASHQSENQTGVAWENLFRNALDNGQCVQVEALIPHFSDLNVKNTDGYTPLIVASMKNHLRCVTAILSGGADIEAKDNYGNSALDWAAFEGYVDVVRVLLEKGANIDATDKRGRTALHEAVDQKRLTVVRLLLEKGAKTSVKDSSGREPIYYARTEELKLLLRQ